MIPNKPKTCSGQSKDVIKHTVKAQQRAPSLWVQTPSLWQTVWYTFTSWLMTQNPILHTKSSMALNVVWVFTLWRLDRPVPSCGSATNEQVEDRSRDKEKNSSSRCLLITTRLRTPWGDLFGVCFVGRRFSYDCFFGETPPKSGVTMQVNFYKANPSPSFNEDSTSLST